MNLPTQQAGCWQVGSVVLGAPQKADPILSPDVADEVMTMMADSIVRLQFEADELRAEVALLREERNILARAKAAVTEGGTGYSGVERPEPPPHFNAALWKRAAVWNRAERLLLETQHRVLRGIERRIRNDRDEAQVKFGACEQLGLALVKTIDELKAEVAGYRDEACRESCRDKAAADGGWANI